MAREVFRVEGLKELKAALDQLPKSTGTSVLKKSLLEAGQSVARDAAARAPDDPKTGGYDLRKSITVTHRLSKRQKKRHRKGSRVEVFIGAGPLSQATQQEFGNILHGAQPFLRPAWDGGKMAVLEHIKKSLWTNIDKARVRLAKRAAKLAAKT